MALDLLAETKRIQPLVCAGEKLSVFFVLNAVQQSINAGPAFWKILITDAQAGLFRTPKCTSNPSFHSTMNHARLECHFMLSANSPLSDEAEIASRKRHSLSRIEAMEHWMAARMISSTLSLSSEFLFVTDQIPQLVEANVFE